MRIGLSYDLKQEVNLEQPGPEDALEEYDSPKTIEFISAALEAGGHSVVRLGGGREFLNNILREKVDLVFNIAEGRGNYRSREAQVPSVLEMLDIPYTGSDPQCLTVCLDKPLTKKIVAAGGVNTPNWRLITGEKEFPEISWKGFSFPAIIKPAYEGSSKGIRHGSLVPTPEQVPEIASELLRYYRQPVMVEEYIDGEEVTVGIIGNLPPKILGIMRVVSKKGNKRFIYSLEVKRDWENLVDYECPARLEENTRDKLAQSSLLVFQLLGCRDFARLDFKVDPQGVPHFLEINPLPGLGDYSDLVIMAIKQDWSHEALIQAVLDAALERYPLCVQG
jgi:D-alanine-D-alanine ligase